MKLFLSIVMLCIIAQVVAQDPPDQVKKAFKEQFPNQKVLVWNNNSTYDYEGDLPERVYEEDEDRTSTDAQKAQIIKNENGYTPYRPEGWRDSVGKKYPQQNFEAPTRYQAQFVMNGIDMTAIITADGTFVIATGKVDTLPQKVTTAIQEAFKGKNYKLVGNMKKAIVSSSETPIYRVFVHVKHEKRRIVKVNENGNIISNTIK